MAASLLLLLQLAAPQAAQKNTIQEYRVDAGETIVEFSVPFAVIHVKGRFQQVHGTILYDTAAPANSSVSIAIETRSLDTGWPHRDEHLRTEDFFDVEKFPTITFQSQRLERSPEGWVATGPFTMHGVTRQISIPFRFLKPPARSAESGWMMLFAAGALRLNRRDFGVDGGDKHNAWFTVAKQATVGDTVDISIQLQGYLPDAGAPRLPQVTEALERIRTVGVDSQLTRLRLRRGDKTDAQWAPYFTGADLTVRALIVDGRVPEAVVMTRGLTQLFPNLTRAWLVNAFVLDVSGDRRGAAQSYERARQVFRPTVRDPNEKFPLVDENWYWVDHLANHAMEWGRVREAAALARESASLYGNVQDGGTLNGSAARAHTTLGLALWRSGDVAGARSAYMRALQLDPQETRAIEWLRRLKG